MILLENAWNFLRAGFAAPSLREMNQAFGKAAGPYGFDKASFVQVAGPGRSMTDPKMLFCHGHERWYAHYAARVFCFNDPCLQKVLTATPFAWSDMPLEMLSGAERLVRLEGAELGEKNGYVVPVEGPEGELFVVQMTSPEEDFAPEARQALHVIGILYSMIAINKFMHGKRKAKFSPLSRREAECLRWVSEGKSDWDMSEILGISHHTVHEHLERAKAKLNARSRTQAAVMAVANGWLVNPPDQGTLRKYRKRDASFEEFKTGEPLRGVLRA